VHAVFGKKFVVVYEIHTIHFMTYHTAAVVLSKCFRPYDASVLSAMDMLHKTVHINSFVQHVWNIG